MVLRPIFVSLSTATLLGVTVLLLVLVRFRKDKILRATSPFLLAITLSGSVLLHAETMIGLLSNGGCEVCCLLRRWLRHLGFALLYGPFILKTWRISVLMTSFKISAARISNCCMLKALAAWLVVLSIYLTVWSIIQPQPYPPFVQQRDEQVFDRVTLCTSFWWETIAVAARLFGLILGGALCYRARNAPHLFDESKPLSYAIWNQALVDVFGLVSRHTIYDQAANGSFNAILNFLGTEIAPSITILVLFTSKLVALFGRHNHVYGSMTGVAGPRRVHRLSILLNSAGDVRRIHCVPCGPLRYLDEDEERGEWDSASSPAASATDGTTSKNKRDQMKEDEYTKAEVDALIEMIYRLKQERKRFELRSLRLENLVRYLQLSCRTNADKSSSLSPNEMMTMNSSELDVKDDDLQLFSNFSQSENNNQKINVKVVDSKSVGKLCESEKKHEFAEVFEDHGPVLNNFHEKTLNLRVSGTGNSLQSTNGDWEKKAANKVHSIKRDQGIPKSNTLTTFLSLSPPGNRGSLLDDDSVTSSEEEAFGCSIHGRERRRRVHQMAVTSDGLLSDEIVSALDSCSKAAMPGLLLSSGFSDNSMVETGARVGETEKGLDGRTINEVSAGLPYYGSKVCHEMTTLKSCDKRIAILTHNNSNDSCNYKNSNLNGYFSIREDINDPLKDREDEGEILRGRGDIDSCEERLTFIMYI